MKRLFIAAAVLMLPVGFIGLSASAQGFEAELTPLPQDKAPSGAVLPDRYIVELKAGENPAAVAPAHGVSVRHVYRKVVNGFSGFVPPGRLAALKADARVLRVTPDREIRAIGKPGGGGGGTTTKEVLTEGVKRIGAAPGNNLGYTGAGVGVAVVDSGVDFAHADLNVNQSPGCSFSSFSGSAQDDHGHGTHVAGTIAAVDNAVGVIGVAPGATIYAVKVLDASGSGSDAAVIAGLDWVAENAAGMSPPIRVVNMSLGRAGSVGDNSTMHAAVLALVGSGVAVVVAAGNDANLEISQQVPAAYPEVISVASTTAKAGTTLSRTIRFTIPADTASYFTTDGTGVTISAPGEDAENITKAGFIQSVGILSTKLGGGTTRMSGTSMAAPHVAGVAALLTEKNPSLTPFLIRDAISAGASGLPGAPVDSPTTTYTFDGVREGVLYAPLALQRIPVPPAP